MARNFRTANTIRVPIRIEYEDREYLNISSTYRWRDLKDTIETIKVPITIVYAERPDRY